MKRSLPRDFLFIRLLCAGLGISTHSFADDATAPCSAGNILDNRTALPAIACMSDEELHALRGGFFQNNQLVIGFGFERIVSVNGEVQEHVLAGLPSLNLTDNIQLVPVSRSVTEGSSRFVVEGLDLGSASAGSVKAVGAGLPDSSPQLQVVPSTTALQDMMNNVIQNSLDNQTIEQVRVLNIDLTGVGDASAFDPQRDLNPTLIENLGF